MTIMFLNTFPGLVYIFCVISQDRLKQNKQTKKSLQSQSIHNFFSIHIVFRVKPKITAK